MRAKLSQKRKVKRKEGKRGVKPACECTRLIYPDKGVRVVLWRREKNEGKRGETCGTDVMCFRKVQTSQLGPIEPERKVS